VAIIFDTTRLVRRRARQTPTGIDRVDLAYCTYLLENAPDTIFVFRGPWPLKLPTPSVRRLVSGAAFGASPETTGRQNILWRDLKAFLGEPRALPAVHTGSIKLAVRGGSESRLSLASLRQLPGLLRGMSPIRGRLDEHIYLNTSHGGLDRIGLLKYLKRRGAKIAMLLHDVIPIDYPEFCRPGEAALHGLRVGNLLSSADIALTVSGYTSQRLEEFERSRTGGSPPVIVSPLGVTDAFLPKSAPLEWQPARPYFVTVGTIEPRKNHNLLLAVWKDLLNRLGDRTPYLVIVGRRGWENWDLKAILDGDQALGGAVLEVKGLGDEAVADLMRGSAALLQPSFVEGFGLPLIEAQSLGVAVIASDIPAHREVASQGATFLDPANLALWSNEILRALEQAPMPLNPQPNPLTMGAHVAETLRLISASVGR
jgi:glycosyltransferase involved in cell wall biosynthesis